MPGTVGVNPKAFLAVGGVGGGQYEIFAVGDARSGNVKRVASAVGEGSVCIQLVHRALAE